MSKRKKKTTYKKGFAAGVATAAGMRGGFAAPSFKGKRPRIPKEVRDAITARVRAEAKDKLTASRINSFIENLIAKAARGDKTYAAMLLKQMAKPLSVMIRDGVVKLVDSPVSGVGSPEGTKIPLSINELSAPISGRNGLYSATEHKIKFVAGNRTGKWIRNLQKTSGISKVVDEDSKQKYQLDDASRPGLLLTTGANRKLQFLCKPDYFNKKASSLANAFGLTSMDKSTTKDQTAYGAFSKIGMHITFTSLNKYVPLHLKLYLVRFTNESMLPTSVFANACNSSLSLRSNLAMPLYTQLTLLNNGTFFDFVKVAPGTRGIFASDSFKNSVDIIATKKVKLFAGDRLKMDYDHLFGSGVNLNKLYDAIKNPDIQSSFPVNFCIIGELWGEEVDAYDSASPNNVIKCTSPCVVHTEYVRTSETCITPQNEDVSINMSSPEGWYSTKYAVRVFTKRPVAVVGERIWNGSYNDLNQTPGYTVPVMSDASESDAGRIS